MHQILSCNSASVGVIKSGFARVSQEGTPWSISCVGAWACFFYINSWWSARGETREEKCTGPAPPHTHTHTHTRAHTHSHRHVHAHTHTHTIHTFSQMHAHTHTHTRPRLAPAFTVCLTSIISSLACCPFVSGGTDPPCTGSCLPAREEGPTAGQSLQEWD